MRDAARAHGHALAALAHAAASVERLRHQDIPREGILFRQQRLVAQGEARRLEFRYHELADLYATFASQAGNSAATAWQRFFDRYADFLDALRLVVSASNLADNRTLAIPVAHTIYFEMGAERRASMGIADSLIRVSAGIEDGDDLIADFAQALDRTAAVAEEREL